MSTWAATADRRTNDGVQRGEPWAVAAIATLCALPSVVAGVVGTGFLSDDWSVWLDFDRLGVLGAMRELAFEAPARPLSAPYYTLVYVIVGDRPVVQSLLIGAVNASVIVAAWRSCRLLIPSTILWPALVVLALAPNHAMTRLWFVVGTYPLAVTLALWSLGDLDRGHVRRAAVLSVAAVLLYEGVAAFAAGISLLWALGQPRARWRQAALVVAPTVVAAGAMLVASPKRDGLGPVPFNNIESLLPGQLGTGLWGTPVLGQIGGVIVLVGLGVALVTQLPSWRSPSSEGRFALLGVLLAALGAAPFVYVGTTFATTGVFDRNNMVAAVGVAVVLGSLWAMLRQRAPVIAGVAAALVVLAFTVAQAEDIDNFATAVSRGGAIVADLATQPGVDTGSAILVVPEQEDDGTGLSDFIYDGDLTGALRYRHGGDWGDVRLVERTDCTAFDRSGDVQLYDWVTGELDLLTGAQAGARCRAAHGGG